MIKGCSGLEGGYKNTLQEEHSAPSSFPPTQRHTVVSIHADDDVPAMATRLEKNVKTKQRNGLG